MAVLPAMSVELPPLGERHRKDPDVPLAPSLQMQAGIRGRPWITGTSLPLIQGT